MPSEERTPLLSGRQGLPLHNGAQQDPVPITYRVCHSAWSWPSQRALVWIRGLIFAYLTGFGPILLHDKLKKVEGVNDLSIWNVPFDFPVISYSLMWWFQFLTWVWSAIHHWWPNLPDVPEVPSPPDNGHWKLWLATKLAPPEPAPSSRKSFFFSLFYTATHVFNFLNMIHFWAVLFPKGHGGFYFAGPDARFSDQYLHPFAVANSFGILPLLSSIEILFLNSIKRQAPVIKHLLAVVALLAGYLGWGKLGKVFTGQYPFFWMDPAEMGKISIVMGYATSFLGLGVAVFAIVYGLSFLKEKLAKPAAERAQYEQLRDSDDAH